MAFRPFIPMRLLVRLATPFGIATLVGLLAGPTVACAQTPGSATKSASPPAGLLDDLPTTVPKATAPKVTPNPAIPSKESTGPSIPRKAPKTGTEPTDSGRAEKLISLLEQASNQLRSAQLNLELQKVQQQILYQMDEWLASDGASNSAGKSVGQEASSADPNADASKPGSSNSKPKSTKPKPAGDVTGNDPTTGTATAQSPVGGTGATSALEKTPRMVADSFWGNLPPQERQRLQNTMPQRFLPQYRRQIEDYYRRLAEEGEK